MIKEVKYSGYSAVPSDYECADGTLAASFNLICEDNQIKPIMQPVPVSLNLTETQTIVYIHETSSYKHYIILDNKFVKWIDSDNTNQPIKDIIDLSGLDIYQITSIGNTLIILCSDGMHYFLWKGNEGEYRHLGNSLPDCTISFGLQGEMKKSEDFDLSFEIASDKIYEELDDEDSLNITNQVLAQVNKFIAEESTKKGKFLYPFFVRYAYRLYDGTLTHHSAPVLMITNSDCAPSVVYHSLTSSGDNYTSAKAWVISTVHSLDYKYESPFSLDSWSDIIKSVDIFVSAPIYSYNQSGKCTKFFSRLSGPTGYTICKQINQTPSHSELPLRYQKHFLAYTYRNATDEDLNDRRDNWGTVELPAFSKDKIKEDIRNCGTFYFLHSFRVDELNTEERTVIPVKEDYLQSLVAREVMTDDYDSHDHLICKQAFAYNARLNISGIQKILFSGGNEIFNYSDGYVTFGTVALEYDIKGKVEVIVFIKQDGKDIIVKGGYSTCGMFAPLLYLYFPNINAYRAIIVRKFEDKTEYLELPLEQHAFLNGAFYFNGWSEKEKSVITLPTISTMEERTIELYNKVYTSEVNNPFYFPLLGINTVGTGRIFAISTAAKALSEGQFGQFPLYAFTTEGVWALAVSNNGTYSAKQPITRDVLLEGSQPLQMDSAVLFATERGLMLISGSQTQCISDIINSNETFDSTQLPAANKLHGLIGHSSGDCSPTVPFLEFLSNCGMLYDYVHQRVIIYNNNYTYAYVYSLKSQQWGMMESTIKSGINSYPEALAVDKNGKLLNFSDMNGNNTLGLLITRPLKLDAPDILKTIDTVIQRGHFDKGHVKAILYGSRNLFSWQIVWSSTDHFLRGFSGTPYKYFRIALVTSLSGGESIFSASVQFATRQTNKLR